MISPGARSKLVWLRNMVARGGFCPRASCRQRNFAKKKPTFECRAAPRAAGGGGDSRDLRSRFVARKGKAGTSGGRSSVSEKIAAFRRGWRRLVRPQRVAVVQLATLPGEKAGCQFGLPHPVEPQPSRGEYNSFLSPAQAAGLLLSVMRQKVGKERSQGDSAPLANPRRNGPNLAEKAPVFECRAAPRP